MGVPYAEVIGDPIAHSKSPLIHKFWLEKLGLEGAYRAIRVPTDDLSAYIAHRRDDPDWRGCSVTVPHKQAVVRLLDEARDNGVGAVNCVVPQRGKLVGHNTDVQGIAVALDDEDSLGNQVCLIGSGGAARAALTFLRQRGTMEVSVIARDIDKARILQRNTMSGGVYSFDRCDQAMAGAEWIINATPLGMTGQPPMPQPILDALDETEDYALVFDMVYAPLETPLLARARALGRKTADGLTMLLGQAAPAFELFFSHRAPREYDGELRELLTR